MILIWGVGHVGSTKLYIFFVFQSNSCPSQTWMKRKSSGQIIDFRWIFPLASGNQTSAAMKNPALFKDFPWFPMKIYEKSLHVSGGFLKVNMAMTHPLSHHVPSASPPGGAWDGAGTRSSESTQWHWYSGEVSDQDPQQHELQWRWCPGPEFYRIFSEKKYAKMPGLFLCLEKSRG